MQTKLPPLFVLDAPNGKALVASNPALTEAQAALVIDIVEVRYPKLVEALREMLRVFPATVGGTGQVNAREQARIVLNQLER